MKKILIVVLVAVSLTLGACNQPAPKISQEQAEEIILNRHAGEIGVVKISEVSHKRGKYIIEWENEENCESGTEHVDDQNGEIIKGEVSIC
ncbi:hypothetical protein [Radiobacillus sp. PE A8.2]|uniref:hypothetical protein n=1 Tax=Radiobacillus sp. PE A8.2 TaxID=3380349 RepID=UPI00388D0A9B